MKVRIKFSKKGVMKYIGHLDLQRYFQKAIRRANIDVAYSEGYSPHQIMSFASPLGVGLESEGEYFDVELNSFITLKEVVDELNKVMAEGMAVLDAVVLPEGAGNAMASIEAARYVVASQNDKVARLFTEEIISKFLANEEILVTKESKKSTRELDIRPLIYDMKVHEKGLELLVCASSAGNIKPGLVIGELCRQNSEVLGKFDLEVTRIELYSLDSEDKLISLGDCGE